jgi:hypothetical protein
MSLRDLNFNVAGDPETDLPFVITDNPQGGQRFDGHFEGSGRLIVSFPLDSAIDGGATIFWQQGEKSCRVILPPGEGQWEAGAAPCQPPDDPTIAIIYDPKSLPDLSVAGQFVRSGGNRFTIIDHTQFALYEKWLREGPDAVEAILAISQLIGFNTARIFLLNTSVHHLLPWEWPNFYTDLPIFSRLLAKYGLYPNFVVFTQTESLMPNPQQQVSHLRQIFDVLHDIPCFVSKVNENNQHDNRIADETIAEPKPQGSRFLLSNGSNGAGAQTVEPVSEIGEYHSNDLSEWQRKVGHNAMEENAWPFNIPVWSSENTRSDKDGFNQTHAYDAAKGAALLSAGSCCHTPEGKLSLPFDVSMQWAQQWVNGAKSVPLEFQDGFYRHRKDLETDTIIRVYSRTIADGREFIVPIRH